jgi:hypothetical protein
LPEEWGKQSAASIKPRSKAVKMPREKDFAWAYCKKIPGSIKILCKFCKEECSGGIYRFKYHFAQIPSPDIGLCKGVPQDVKHQSRLAIDCMNELKAKKARINAEMAMVQVAKLLLIPPCHLPLLNSQCRAQAFMFHACLKIKAKCHILSFLQNLSTRGENVHTFFVPAHNPMPNPTWVAWVGKITSIVKQKRPLLILVIF